jgi:hypothetical protein
MPQVGQLARVGIDTVATEEAGGPFHAAAAVVWVARGLRDEHRAALEWLDEVTGEAVDIFGVEVEA